MSLTVTRSIRCPIPHWTRARPLALLCASLAAAGADAPGDVLGGRPGPPAPPDDDPEPRVTLVLEGLVLALDGNPAEGAVVSSSRAARG